MEASIKDGNIKTFVKLLQCASKFGDDLNISANKDLWELSVTNSSKSAFCLFKLQKSFFCRYKALGTSVEQRRGVKCQLLVKSALSVLGKALPSSNVERVDLKIHDPDNSLRSKRKRNRAVSDGDTTGDEGSDDELSRGIEAYLVMKLVCKHGVTKRHSLHLGTTEFLRADVDPDTTPSGFLVPARTLRTWLDHFHIGLTSSSISTAGGSTTIRQENQLSWMFARDEVRVKSWEGGTKELSTEIKVKKEDFEDYDVFNGRVDLTLPMREFRATLALADQLSIKLVVAFSEAGQPLTLTSDPNDADQDETPDIFCAIATTTCDQFLSIKTQSEQPQSNGRTDSGPGNSFHNRANSRQREYSVGANGSNANGNGDGGDRNVRPRLGSEPTSRRGRLSLSTQPSRVSNSIPTTTNRASGGPINSQQRDRNGNGAEALFIPTDTQYQLDDHDPDRYESHAALRLSQAEQEAIAELGNADDLLDAMDDLQHEEEVEEMRASQQAASQAPPPPPPSIRQPLADLPIDTNNNIPGPSTQAVAAEEDNANKDAEAEGGEGDEDGDITRQADFEVHEHEVADVEANEAGDLTSGPGNATTGPTEEMDVTADPVAQVDEIEEDETLPATQALSEDERRFNAFFED